MRCLLVTDPIDRFDVSIDTSVGLMHAAQDAGVEVLVTSPSDLEVVDGRPRAWATPLTLMPSGRAGGALWSVPDPWCERGETHPVDVDTMDAVFVRTEPPVDVDYLSACHVLDLVDRTRTAIVNEPRGIRQCSEHLLGLSFPDLIPPTVVTSRLDTVREFLRENGIGVLKPIDGFSGRGVFVVDPDDVNVNSIVETATQRGRRAVMVQPWLPEVHDGSKRLIVLDGQIIGAAARHPVPGDFRICHPDAAAVVTTRDRQIVERLRPVLAHHGLRLAGLDVIGGYLIEVNLTSVGALRKIDGLLGTRLCAAVIDRVLDPANQTHRLVRNEVS